jgi:hypothetical protein
MSSNQTTPQTYPYVPMPMSIPIPMPMPMPTSAPPPNYDTLDENSPMESQPDAIKIRLRPNQLTVIKRCLELENSYQSTVNGNKINMQSRVSIIGEKVGGGKSAIVLGIIAKQPQCNKDMNITQYTVVESNKYVQYQISRTYGNNNIIYKTLPINLIVIPFSIRKQWEEYVSRFVDETKIKVLIVYNNVSKYTIKEYAKHQIVIVINTVYNDFIKLFHSYADSKGISIKFSRIIFDEADSIKIPSCREAEAHQYYLVSASLDSIFNNHIRNIGMLKDMCRYFRSMGIDMFKLLVAKNTDEFVIHSFDLRDPKTFIVKCKNPLVLNVLFGFVGDDIVNMINAGDINGIIEKYNINTVSETNVVSTICRTYEVELQNRQIDLDSAIKKTYYSDVYKEEAIKKIRSDIRAINDKIQGIKERISETSCPICMDEFKNKAMTPCCHKTFCFECISMVLTQNNTCPMCRKQFKSIRDLILLKESADSSKKEATELEDPNALKDKLIMFEEILQKITANKDYRLLIFSEYDNSFLKVVELLDKYHVKHSQISGTGAHIANLIGQYNRGEKRCFMLNARYFGAGLNLEKTTDAIIYHKMSPDLEKQVIGRAQRPGRTCILNIWKLCYENEL